MQAFVPNFAFIGGCANPMARMISSVVGFLAMPEA